jgi:hypothetical protein
VYSVEVSRSPGSLPTPEELIELISNIIMTENWFSRSIQFADNPWPCRSPSRKAAAAAAAAAAASAAAAAAAAEFESCGMLKSARSNISSLMPPRKSAQAPVAAPSTRPRRAAAAKTAAPSAQPVAKAIAKAQSSKKAKATRAKPAAKPSAAKKGSKQGKASTATSVYAKEFRSVPIQPSNMHTIPLTLLISPPPYPQIHSVPSPVAASLAKKIISDLQTSDDASEACDDQALAAIDMATEALSRRIIAAVDEISNPKANAPKATKQLAAKMAKIIVEAAASKAEIPSKSIRTFSFSNAFGEEFQLTVDASGKNGILAGDETDWENIHIKGDTLQSDFMFNREELSWLRQSWKSATGRNLKHPTMTAEQQLLQAGIVHKVGASKVVNCVAKKADAKKSKTEPVQKKAAKRK